jgi:group I intron endonuclease
MVIYTVYIATNKFNSKVYIGYTNNLKKRITQHFVDSKTKKTKFYTAIRKYGFENFTFNILYQSKDGEHCLTVMEPYFIKEYNSYEKGYNGDLGGRGVPVKKQSSKSNLARSKALKGKKHRHRTPEMNAANSARQRGRKQTMQHRINSSKAKKGKKHSTEHVYNQAMAQSSSFKFVDPNGNLHEGKNITAFSKQHNLTASAMNQVFNGKLKQHKGWTKFIVY